jgi:hypothetical protein
MKAAKTVKKNKDRPPRLSHQFLRDMQWDFDHMHELAALRFIEEIAPAMRPATHRHHLRPHRDRLVAT